VYTTIYADGQLLYSSSFQEAEVLVLPPTCSAEVGKTGSLDFVMLPGHYLYDNLRKLKTLVVAYVGELEVFRGRVLDWTLDFHNQKKVHCEGNLAYLLDTVQPPRKVKMEVVKYFGQIVAEHNVQVEEEKRFVVGNVTIDEARKEVDFEDGTYRNTRDAIETDLLSIYGGFLQPRTVDGTTYLDYLKDTGTPGTQKLEFGSNIIDLGASLSAVDIFTVLLPTGKAKESKDKNAPAWPITVESINGDSKLIEYLDGIAKYGRIVATQNFPQADTPEKVYEEGMAYFEKMFKEPPLVIEVTAIDLHLLDEEVGQIWIGQTFPVISPPHNIDVVLMCLSIQYDFANPENTKFRFGTPDKPTAYGRTSGPISSSVGKTSGGPGGGAVGQQYKYIKEMQDAIEIAAQNILLKVDKDGLVAAINASTEGIKIYGKNVEINGKDGFAFTAGALVGKGLETLLDEAYSRITGTENQLNLEVVKKNAVIAAINLSEEGAKIFGNVVTITGPQGIIAQGNLLVQGDISADRAAFQNLITGTGSVSHLWAQRMTASTLYLSGYQVGIRNQKIVTNVVIGVEKDLDGFVKNVTLTETSEYVAVLKVSL
jgi:hypothetical protein